MSSARHAAPLIIFEIIRSFFVGFKCSNRSLTFWICDACSFKVAVKAYSFATVGIPLSCIYVFASCKCFLCDDLILVFDHSQSSMGIFQLMHSHFIFLDSVKAVFVHCANRLLSQSTLILCTLETATVESRRPAFDVCFGLCSPSRVSAFSALNLVRFKSTVVEEPVQRYQNHHGEIDPATPCDFFDRQTPRQHQRYNPHAHRNAPTG